MSTSKEAYNVLVAAVKGLGYRTSVDLFDFSRATETILDKLFTIFPQPTSGIAPSPSCVSYNRLWQLNIAFSTTRTGEVGTLRDVLLDAEDAVVDTLSALDWVDPGGISVSYRPYQDGLYIVLEVGILTSYERSV
jgi:hypothetical protein